MTIFNSILKGKIWIIGGRFYDAKKQKYKLNHESYILDEISKEWKGGEPELVVPRHSEVFLVYFYSNKFIFKGKIRVSYPKATLLMT